MKENCFNLNSYSINGNFIYEGYGIENTGGLFNWYYTERGNKDVLMYFGNEKEIVAYAFTEIKTDVLANIHCIGFTANKEKAKEIGGLLKNLNIDYIEDSIPYNGIASPVYRIFVLGCSIRQTEHLKKIFFEEL